MVKTKKRTFFQELAYRLKQDSPPFFRKVQRIGMGILGLCTTATLLEVTSAFEGLGITPPEWITKVFHYGIAIGLLVKGLAKTPVADHVPNPAVKIETP